ncbi:dipeptide transport ATP-binding protein [alpha proteobacterium BAL199]|jgi:oligopeptide/dipeptide ABC transporter ATP-binding protein|nr:dipeptide transport ATP-binding protein [alpha proteobacterium BAL199]
MLALEDLKVHFDVSRRRRERLVVKAVDGVTLRLRKGEAFGLVGESGSGKSTIGKAALHLVPITGGRLVIAGEDLTRLDRAAEKKLRRTAQMIFQDPHSALNPRMTIMRSVAEPLVLHTAIRGAALTSRVAELLEIVGLSRQFLYRYPHELSGGQKQRVCIARAIALEPALLILDEPTSALDVSVQSQILEFLKKLQADLGLTYLFISHNLAVVRYLCRRVAVMYLGVIVEEGETEAVFENPRHPYTQALLKAVPYPQAVQPDRGPPLQGDIPSPVDLPPGCRFHQRCPAAIPGVCDIVVPPEVRSGDTMVRCHLFTAADPGH